MRRFAIVLLAASAFSAGATTIATGSALPTGPTDPHIKDGSAARKLASARARWKAHGAVSYRYKVTQSCFCGPRDASATIIVRHGKRSGSTDRLLPASSVPRLFKIVANAINRKVAKITVTYDTKLGFVKHVYVDSSAMIADEEVGYDVSGFKLLAK